MLQSLLSRLDLRFTIEEEWGNDLSDEELKGVKQDRKILQRGEPTRMQK